MWKMNPHPWQMRLQFPEEARELEDVFLDEEITNLGLKYKKTKLKRKTIFKIPLTNGMELWISPTDVGPKGQFEWISWYEPHNHSHQPNPSIPKYLISIRACVQLVCRDTGKNEVIHTFTNLQDNLEDLIRSSLVFIHRDLGYQLSPIVKINRNSNERI
jgi:hypothetical protein